MFVSEAYDSRNTRSDSIASGLLLHLLGISMLLAVPIAVLSNKPAALKLRTCILTQSMPVYYDNSNSYAFPYTLLTG